ncbi:MAG: hypothetical protein KAG89_09675 [Fulvimarina manganoxydans]|uniref:hypothetical protein n=1 Tax=Fulvimarina manganoxydans TaxID=937218 RepID=UPI002355E134|nr:hypothetical protein [Fulvimarina manganoxydans]MCK5932421.1 hypothetical protein [Fulvimarina manganoxydans]
MFTLIVTSIIYAAGPQERIEAIDTASISGFETVELCEAAAKTIGGQALNVERQAVCVKTR